MAILVDRTTNVLVQGITGKEGARAVSEMLTYGTPVLAGVRPGKSGELVHGVPVFNTVSEAIIAHPRVNASFIAVPAPHVPNAALEAIAARIPLIVILTEHVPLYRGACIMLRAREAGLRVVGPSSVGIISPGRGKIGAIGSSATANIFCPGRIGIISKSGGMTAEVAAVLGRSGFGVSTAIGIGGDMILGSDFVNMLQLFRNDSETDAVVLFGEIGGTYEEQAAEYLASAPFGKSIIALVAGRFTEQLPQGTALGHAGAVVARGRGSYRSKVEALRAAGVRVADRLEQIPILLKQALYAQQRGRTHNSAHT